MLMLVAIQTEQQEYRCITVHVTKSAQFQLKMYQKLFGDQTSFRPILFGWGSIRLSRDPVGKEGEEKQGREERSRPSQ